MGIRKFSKQKIDIMNKNLQTIVEFVDENIVPYISDTIIIEFGELVEEGHRIGAPKHPRYKVCVSNNTINDCFHMWGYDMYGKILPTADKKHKSRDYDIAFDYDGTYCESWAYELISEWTSIKPQLMKIVEHEKTKQLSIFENFQV